MEADVKLALKREEEKRNRVIMDAKWEDLRRKENLLKESFISFNKVITVSVLFYALVVFG